MTVLSGPTRRALLIVVAALAFALSACSSPASARAALEFGGPTVDGGRFEAASLTGKPAVLWFWAPWCSVCRAEGPGVAAVAHEFEGRVAFVGVPGLGQVPDMKTFVGDTGTGAFTHVVDADGALWQRFGVVAQPAFAFVGADGTVRTVAGGMDADSLRQATGALLAG